MASAWDRYRDPVLEAFDGAEIVESGLDWVTVTAKEEKVCGELIDLGRHIQDVQRSFGFVAKPTGFQGYRGMSTEGCMYGVRGDGALLRVSGYLAHEYAPAIPTLGTHVSRLDLQVTVSLRRDSRALARNWLDGLNASYGRRGSDGQPATKLVDSYSRGACAYIGARTSALYGRLYDKSREGTGGYPANSWRLECEVKRHRSTPYFERLSSTSFDPGTIAGWVLEQFRRWGVNHEIETNPAIPTPVVRVPKSDVQRRLEWVARVAAPVLRSLYEAGYHEQATCAAYAWMMPETSE